MSAYSTPLRYLCLTDKYQLESDIDTWWARIVGDKTTWGPDLDDWDSSLTLEKNLQQRFGNLEDFDAVFLSHSFSSLPLRHTPPSPTYMANKPTIVFLHEVLAVEEFQDRKRFPICDVSGIDIVLHTYTETEMDSYYALRSLAQTKSSAIRLSQQLISYLPHHVRCDIYFPPKERNSFRDIDVLLVGRCHESLYPLRARWARLVHENRWTNAVHFAVPYGLKEKWTESERIHQQQEYANLLSRARIVLSCSSHWRYMLGKFTEIAASGSFLISDVPTHLPIEFSNNMGIVSNQMSDSELIEVVNYWLNNTHERERRANRLGVFVRDQMDMHWFWKKVDDAVLRWKQAYTSGVRISV